MEVEDQDTTCFGAWRRHGPGLGGGGVCEPKRQSVGFLPSRSFFLFSLDREIPFSPCLPGPAVPARGPWERPLVATVQMIVICAMRQNQMCLVGAGVWVGVGGVPGLPAASPGSHASA